MHEGMCSTKHSSQTPSRSRPLQGCLSVVLALACGTSCGSVSQASTSTVSSARDQAAHDQASMPSLSVDDSLVDDVVGESDASTSHEDALDAGWAYLGVGGTGFGAQAEKVVVSFRVGLQREIQAFAIALDGTVSDAERKALRHALRCRRTSRTHRMDQGLFAKLADLSKHFDGRTIEVVSAYRHGVHANPGSRHRHGRAIDIKIDGVKATEIRDYLWSRYSEEVGVGYYRQQQFVHLDHRTNFPATAWTQKSHNAENNYRPRWARAQHSFELLIAAVDTEI